MQNQGDHYLFKHSQEAYITVFRVHVDDIIIYQDDLVEKQPLKEKLANKASLIFIEYVLDLLKDHRKLGCKAIGIPIMKNQIMGNDEKSTKVDKVQYQRLVEKLIYLAHTGSDVAYVISIVRQFMHDLRVIHFQVVDRIHSILKLNRQ